MASVGVRKTRQPLLPGIPAARPPGLSSRAGVHPPRTPRPGVGSRSAYHGPLGGRPRPPDPPQARRARRTARHRAAGRLRLPAPLTPIPAFQLRPPAPRNRRTPLMSLTFHWFLPTQGDSRGLVADGDPADASAWRSRPPSAGYLTQIARAAEDLGFEGVLTPTGAWCEDAWITTAIVLGAVQRLKFLVAFRPGLVSPTLAAQMAATYQRLSGGRLLLNVVTGGESAEQRSYGDFLDKEARYARTDEFLQIVTRLWEGDTVTFRGAHLTVEEAVLHQPPPQRPPLYFG